MRLVTLCTMLSIIAVSYATPTVMKLEQPLAVENFTFNNIHASTSQGVIYAKEHVICIHTIPASMQTYRVTIYSSVGGNGYFLTKDRSTLPIQFSWRSSRAANGDPLISNQPLIVNNGGNAQGQCADGSAAVLRVTINGNNIARQEAGHYTGQFSIVITPLI